MVEEATIRCLADYEHSSEERLKGPMYGIVVDATRRFFKPHNSKYVASLKVIDHTWNKAKSPAGFVPFMKLVLISSVRDDIPNIKTIGSIIKLKDGALKRINDMKSSSLMCTWDGATASNKWELFSSEPEQEEKSAKASDAQEEKYLATLRTFTKSYFAEQYFLDVANTLTMAKNSDTEFDVIVRLAKAGLVSEGDGKSFDLKLVDHTGKAHLRIPQGVMAEEFPKLDNSALLMVKGARYRDAKENIIELKDYGNLLIVPVASIIATRFFELTHLYNEGTKVEQRITQEGLTKSFTVSQIADPTLLLSPIKSIFASTEPLPRYRLRVYVVDIGPKDVHSWVKGYCAACMKSFDLTDQDEPTQPKCLICEKEAQTIFQIQLFVKDWKDRDSDEIYKLMLYTHNGKGNGFFDHEPAVNLRRDQRLYQKLKSMHRLLTKYGVYLDCVVERMSKEMNAYFQVCDTVVSCDCVREIKD